MMNLNLNRILDLKKWQDLQDTLALVTRLAMITVDYKGVPVTVHSQPRPFCQAVRQDPNLFRGCQKCDSRGGLEAVRINGPYIYRCHCGIVDLAIPIMLEDRYVGAVMAGQVRLAEGDETGLEQIVVTPDKEIARLRKDPDLRRKYEALPQLSAEEVTRAGQLLFSLCNYIVGEATHKQLILEMYERAFRTTVSEQDVPEAEYAAGSVERIRHEMTEAVAGAYLRGGEAPVKCRNATLKPAFNYIFRNKGENFSQKKMADLCHVSPSYFSRLFFQETGMNFSSYVARQKVEWAKQLLEKTTLPVSGISEELGFSDPGYFIRTFRKYENITPLLYRKYYQEGERFRDNSGQTVN